MRRELQSEREQAEQAAKMCLGAVITVHLILLLLSLFRAIPVLMERLEWVSR